MRLRYSRAKCAVQRRATLSADVSLQPRVKRIHHGPFDAPAASGPTN
jgi:hypothetical protein